MLIIIDREQLRMVAAAANRKWINLVAYVDFPNVATLIVDSEEGRTWTALDAKEMAMLYTNMSGQPAPEYNVAIEQLRNYANTWGNYPKTEAELEVQAEAIFREEQANADPEADALAQKQAERQAHQAAIAMAEKASASLTPEQRAAQAPTAPKAPKGHQADGAVPAKGVTKRVWDIADQVLAVDPNRPKTDFRAFRRTIIERAAAEGINEGTAATQFGKWKLGKGF